MPMATLGKTHQARYGLRAILAAMSSRNVFLLALLEVPRAR